MKRILIMLALLALVAVFAVPAGASPPPADKDGCYTIQGGSVVDSFGNPLSVGFDEFGYNYQAHMFAGPYDGFDRVWGNDTSDFADDFLIMKWSNDWLSNVDCDGDGKLDRGFNTDTPGISRGWLTNHVEGDYDSDGDGIQDAHYTDFVKIVWVGAGGDLWGQYTIIEEVYNDPVGGYNGLLTKVGAPGFGLNDHWTTN